MHATAFIIFVAGPGVTRDSVHLGADVEDGVGSACPDLRRPRDAIEEQRELKRSLVNPREWDRDLS